MEEKIKAIIGEDVDVSVYLSLAQAEVLSWVYGKDHQLEELPAWLEPVTIMAVVVGFNQSGAEGESAETVDGVQHVFKHDTMVSYIHNNAPGHAKIV